MICFDSDWPRIPIIHILIATHLLSPRLLLQAGCDVNIKDKDGWSPLHAAVHWEQQQAAEILTEAGADFSIRNNIVCLSPLFYCCCSLSVYLYYDVPCRLSLQGTKLFQSLIGSGTTLNLMSYRVWYHIGYSTLLVLTPYGLWYQIIVAQ